MSQIVASSLVRRVIAGKISLSHPSADTFLVKHMSGKMHITSIFKSIGLLFLPMHSKNNNKLCIFSVHASTKSGECKSWLLLFKSSSHMKLLFVCPLHALPNKRNKKTKWTEQPGEQINLQLARPNPVPVNPLHRPHPPSDPLCNLQHSPQIKHYTRQLHWTELIK